MTSVQIINGVSVYICVVRLFPASPWFDHLANADDSDKDERHCCQLEALSVLKINSPQIVKPTICRI